jgi:transposase
VKHGRKEYAFYATGATKRTTRTPWKASVRSTHVQISGKYMNRDLLEFTFRASNRELVNGMCDLLVRAL